MKELLDTWASVYANHAAVRTGISFVHVGGLLIGGGCAVAADVTTISLARSQSHVGGGELALLSRTHRLVVIGLTGIVASGLLLFAADVDTFWHSRVYWLKMALVALLLFNGVLLTIAERQVRLGHPQAGRRLRNSALASLSLWFLTTLAGAALPNIG